jgi:glycosyltransferase involved in cell wall biosynthesis
MEGGPKAILECAASQTKIISTDVGLAKEILASEQIYGNFLEAKELIIEDISHRRLDKFMPMNFLKAQSFLADKQPAYLKTLYSKIANHPEKIKNFFKPIKDKEWHLRDLIFPVKKRATIFFKFHDGPWGGGNQFLKALSIGLKKQGWKITNKINSFSKIVLFNSFHVDFEKLKRLNIENKLIVHRIDGPTFLIRGKDKDLDDKIFQVNRKIADVTVFQSAWSLIANLASGYQPVNPIIISNASNPDFFKHNEKAPFLGQRKIRLITTCWSDNPAKGGSIYKWLDDNLNWNKFEYTFIGRVSEKFSNIKLLEPLPTIELAKVLKQHDIFIAASDNDPCSNSLIEGLSCGLPTIYFNRGGHPELVGFGGLGFESKEEILSLLNLVGDNLESFQNLVKANDLKKITEKYIECFNLYEN